MTTDQHAFHEVLSHGGALDTLYRLAVHGPAESGDLPSKTGFSILCHYNLAIRDPLTYVGIITREGEELFKKLTWKNGTATGKQILDAQKVRKVHGVNVITHETVKGTVATIIAGDLYE